jgi:hypothetical protein
VKKPLRLIAVVIGSAVALTVGAGATGAAPAFAAGAAPAFAAKKGGCEPLGSVRFTEQHLAELRWGGISSGWRRRATSTSP